MNKNSKSFRTAYFAVMIGLCLIIGYIEAILPLNLGVFGAKLGITNFIILILLKKNGLRAALFINLARILIIGMLFGSVFSLSYSLFGGIASTVLMYFLIKIKSLSLIGVSAAGGAMHNLAQTLCAALMLGTPSVLKLLPFLLLLGMVAGIFCGVLAHIILGRLDKISL